MANMLFTMLGIFSPMANVIFMLSVVIGFFGVFIPWNEKRKKNGGNRSAEKAGEWGGTPAPMSRAKALARMISWIPVFVIGMTMLIACAVIGIPVLIALGGGLMIVSLLGMERAGRDFRAGRPLRTPRPSKPVFRPESHDHEHITVSGQNAKARLEQFEVLKNAGLLTEEEFKKKQKEILKGP